MTDLDRPAIDNEFSHDLDGAVGLDNIEDAPGFGYTTVLTKDQNDNTVSLTLKLNCRCTDLGNAKRFIAMHSEDLRYRRQTGQWFIWDGRREDMQLGVWVVFA